MKWYKWYSFRSSKDDLQLGPRVSRLENQLKMAVEIQKLQTKMLQNQATLIQYLMDKKDA